MISALQHVRYLPTTQMVSLSALSLGISCLPSDLGILSTLTLSGIYCIRNKTHLSEWVQWSNPASQLARLG